MAYDEALAARVRSTLHRRKGLGEKKMFGGLCFLINGNMAAGVVEDRLMVRVGKDKHDEALALPHARPMDFTGKPMRGMVYVEPAGLREDADLKAWLDRGVRFARSLPAK